METEVLVIIDMQRYFLRRAKKLRRLMTPEDWGEVRGKIIELVHIAKRKNIPIVVLEFAPETYGNTDYLIKRAIGKYPLARFVPKFSNDGSGELSELFPQCGIAPSKFFVCGVNRCSCVSHTTGGINCAWKTIPIVLCEDAIGDENYNTYAWDKDFPYDRINKPENLVFSTIEAMA